MNIYLALRERSIDDTFALVEDEFYVDVGASLHVLLCVDDLLGVPP